VAHASVCALGRLDRCCASAQCSLSNDRGEFRLHGVSAEVWAIAASAPGYLPRQRLLPDRAADASHGLEIELEPGGVELQGSVVDATGGPVAFAAVTLQSPAAAFDPLTVASDAEGRFSASVARGEVHVSAQAEAYSQAIQRVSAPARGVTLALTPAASIVGTVVRADSEQPVAGVTVTALALGRDPELPSSAQSGLDGGFRLPGLSGGDVYQVFASGPAWRSAETWVTTAVGRTSELVPLRVTPASVLSGVVQRAGQPCPGAELHVAGPLSSSARAGSDGRVRLVGLLPGSYRVSVYCPGALSQQDSIQLGSEPLQHTWELSPGRSLSGRVEDARAAPVVGALVSVVPAGDPTDRLPTQCTSGRGGEFTCSGLSEGAYDCSVVDSGDPTREVVRVVIAAGPAPSVLLRERPSGSIRVSIEPAPRAGSRGPRVFARAASGFPWEAAAGPGGFSFERLPLGHYEVYVELPSASQRPASVLLREHGQLIELELQAPPLHSIRGQVRDAQGNPWVDAWVSAAPSELNVRPPAASDPVVVTDEHGDFTLSALAPGAYDLRVWEGARSGELRGVVAGDLARVVLREQAPAVARAEADEAPEGGALAR
jgi:hypothetical protein